MKVLCTLIACLLFHTAFAQTQVPHVFQSGQPALAAEVNANFDELESVADESLSRVSALEGEVAANNSDIVANANQIQSNTDAIVSGDAALAGRLAPLVFDANGTEIGQLISIGENLWGLLAINQSGYIQNVSFRDGALDGGTLVYQSSDCAGTPFATDTFGGHVQTYFDSFGNPNLYYVDKAAGPISNFTSGSLSFERGCFVQSDLNSVVWPVTVNDPSVTGISSLSYSLPIRIERVN